MHDCFGKLLKPFDRVRAAAKEELEAQGHKDSPAVFDGEKVVLTGNPAATTCNVQVVDEVGWPAFLCGPDGSGIASFAFKGSLGYATARTLVKLDG